MKVITYATLKGGTGKTMTTFSTAGILAERKNKVLIFDADPQANITSNLGIDETQEGFIGIQEIFENPKFDVNKLIIRSPIEELPTLDIIPSSVFLTATETKIISLAGREFLLRNYIRKNADIFEKYDYIMFDTNPNMGIVNQNVFLVSDAIILITIPGKNGLKGAELFEALWGDIIDRLGMKNNIKGLLINMLDQRLKLQKEFIEYCLDEEDIDEEDIRKILFKAIIPKNAKLAETEIEVRPINMYDKLSSGYTAYNKFVDELLERL